MSHAHTRYSAENGTSHSDKGIGNGQLQKPVLSVMPSSSAEVRWVQ
jgi:hypothetical protein